MLKVSVSLCMQVEVLWRAKGIYGYVSEKQGKGRKWEGKLKEKRSKVEMYSEVLTPIISGTARSAQGKPIFVFQ